MARSFLSFTLALATATLMLGLGAVPASAQPAPPVTPSTTAPAAKTYPEVAEAFQKFGRSRNYKECIKDLELVGRKYPELPSPYVLMYNFFNLKEVNQPNMARLQLEQGIRVNPSDPEPWVMLGNIALQERRTAEATLDFEEAKKLLATYSNKERKAVLDQQMMSGVAQLAEIVEDWKGAEAKLRELLTLAPRDLVAHQRLARALFWQTKAGEAYTVLKEAKKIDHDDFASGKKPREEFLTPEAIMAQYYLGFEGPKSEQPQTWFKAALVKAPDDLTTRQVVAIWALESGKIDYARDQAENALRIEKEKKLTSSLVGRMLRGLVALWEKDWKGAQNYFEQVTLEAPNDFVARNNLALALVEQDDADKKRRALEYAQNNYTSNKQSPDALSTLGWVYFRRNEFDQAGLALDQAVKATNGQINNADTATYLAHILYHLDKKWQAKEILDNIFKSERPFSMKPEAKILWEKVKDATKPTEATPAPAAVPTKP